MPKKNSKGYTDSDSPAQCRKCGSREFVAEVEGEITGKAYFKAPDKIEGENEEYLASDDAEIEPDTYDIEWHQTSQYDWECKDCGSNDYITFDEVIDNILPKQKAYEQAVAEGRVIIIHAGQIDMFTGKPVGKTIERIRESA